MRFRFRDASGFAIAAATVQAARGATIVRAACLCRRAKRFARRFPEECYLRAKIDPLGAEKFRRACRAIACRCSPRRDSKSGRATPGDKRNRCLLYTSDAADDLLCV